MADPALRNTLLAIALIGIFAYNFTVTLALLAKVTFHGGAGTYSLLTSCMGIGAVIGGLLAAHRARPTPRLLQVLALIFGGLLAVVALAPTLIAAAVSHRVHGGGLHRLHRHCQRHLAVERRTGHAGSGDGPLRHGLSGYHADRCAAGGCHRPVDQSEDSLLCGAIATVIAAGLLMWRHEAAIGGWTNSPTTRFERSKDAVRNVESKVA